MALELVTGAVLEPIVYAQAIHHMHINAYDDDIDESSIEYLETLIKAVREDIETFTGRALLTQTWKYYRDSWPTENYFDIPKPPLQSVTSVKYTDSDGTETTMTLTTDYLVDSVDKARPGRIVLPYNETWPTAILHPRNPIKIEFIAGYGALAEDIPNRIRQACLIQVADLYENRETIIVGKGFQRLDTVERLLWPYRVRVI